MKTYILTNFGPIWGQKGLKNLAHMGHVSHTTGNTHNMHVNQVSWSCIKNLLRKWPKTWKKHFLPIFAFKDPLKKLEAKKSRFYSHNLLGNIIVHTHAKYRKYQWKVREPIYSIWKKVDRQTDRQTDRQMARHKISSTDYVSSGAKSEPCIQGIKRIIPQMFQIVP